VSGPPAVSDAPALRGVRTALERAGYTRDQVLAALRTDIHLTPQPGEVAVFERRLSARTPQHTLIKLFLVGSTVDSADLAASLPDLPQDVLLRLGLVEAVPGGVRATLRIIPHGDIVVACDRNHPDDPEPQGADVVTGLNSPAILLADLTVRKAVRSALDLGTGGGIQALLLSGHCGRVVATDVNRRALDYAALNLALNGIENVELRLGSWFEPVAGERFDLITSNPPYVISPESSYLYRDSGLSVDSLCRRLVREAPEHLEEGGFAHLLVSWALRQAEEWSAPLRRWLDGLPCDAWLLHYLTDDPLSQAAKWNQPTRAGQFETYASVLDAWTDYYRREGIDQIAFGAVILRRRSDGPNWVRTDSFRGGVGSSGPLVLRVFAAEDFLRSHAGRDLLDQRFALAPAHRLEQRLVAREGAWQLQSSTLHLTEGIGFQGHLDLRTAHLLQHLDGSRTLHEAIRQTSRDLELSGPDSAALAELAEPMARRLYQLGFLMRGAG
jgi:methylase of polypeptide subunit release factors